jgi:hypothetical protein
MAQLTPFSTSKAHAKVRWAMQQLRLAQQYWTEEDFLFLLKMNSEWTEEHIESFMESDIESDFIISYRAGSEVPTSLLEREMKLRQFLGDVLQIAQVNPAILTPQTISSVLTRMQEYSNLDLDVLNSTDEIVLADKRFAIIKQMTEGIPVPSNPNPMILDKASASITSFIGLLPYVRENHDLHVAYWTDRIRQENTQDHPNYFRISCYDKMIYLHEQMKVKNAQEQQADQMNANAPMMQAQAQAAQAQAQSEAQSQLAVQGQILQGKAQMEAIRQQAKSEMQEKKEQSIAEREQAAHDRLQGDQRTKFQMDQESENNNFQRDRAAAQQDFANEVGHTILQAGLNKNNGTKSDSSKSR